MRTVVVTLPTLLADFVVDALDAVVSLDVVAVLPSRDDLSASLSRLAPWLVLAGGTDREHDELAASIRATSPSSHVLVLDPDARRATLYWTTAAGAPVLRAMEDFSAVELADAFRAACARL
ncbi:hypothetical protein [Variovorax sp. dw_954]|uniref:hypothetical protein n=1 Tax=Variovorax sp. dw_954 TaxID=2720078 RepID=UPI001BD24A62|nr:hypothetical protein [Variovorax sp. dw_954]